MEGDQNKKADFKDPGTLEEIFKDFVNPPSLEQTRTSVTEEGQVLKQTRTSTDLINGRRVENEVHQTIYADCGCEFRSQKTFVSNISKRIGCQDCATQCDDCRLRGFRNEFRKKPGARGPLCPGCFRKAVIIYVVKFPWIILKALLDSASRIN